MSPAHPEPHRFLCSEPLLLACSRTAGQSQRRFVLNHQLPDRADFQHLREEAKTLLRELNSSQPSALELAASLDPSLIASRAKLADAQRLIARKYGFASWNQLKEAVEIPQLMERFVTFVNEQRADKLDELLRNEKAVRDRIDEPIFSFDSPALVATGSADIARVLLRHGARPSVRSRWWAGGFGALDLASPAKVRVLLEFGAQFDVWSAAAHGQAERLRELLTDDPRLANAPGGDGRPPLSFATTVEAAQLLLEFGADPNVRDVDHESTALQYQINRPEIARLLLANGAEPDPFVLTQLDDADAIRAYIRQHPDAGEARVGLPPYTTSQSNGGHIYIWEVGHGRTPYLMAIERGKSAAREVWEGVASPAEKLVAACMAGDSATVATLLDQHPGLGASLPTDLASALPHAAAAGKLEAVRLMLQAGFPIDARGQDTGSALHLACWHGHLEIVRLLLGLLPLEARDEVHGSTPLGWAAHGSVWCRRPGADYPAIVEALLEAGADVHATANKNGVTLLAMADKRKDVRSVLLRYGAK